jgi:hypothetical protein
MTNAEPFEYSGSKLKHLDQHLASHKIKKRKKLLFNPAFQEVLCFEDEKPTLFSIKLIKSKILLVRLKLIIHCVPAMVCGLLFII